MCKHLGKVQNIRWTREGVRDQWRCVECGAKMTAADLARNYADFAKP